MCLATSNNLLLVLQDPLKTHFSFSHELTTFWSAKKRHKDTFFPTLHPLFPVIFATATVVAFVLLRNSMFNFHSYTQRQATPTQKSARKWRCDLSWLLAQKITKGIHSCKAASLNHPIEAVVNSFHSKRMEHWNSWLMPSEKERGKSYQR